METPKQRTIVFPDGSTAKVYPDAETAKAALKIEEKPSPWKSLKAAFMRWLISLLP